jgi:ribosomal-protein-alanine N-acetyltransferase
MDDIETARLVLRLAPPESVGDPVTLRHARAALAADPGYAPWSVRAMLLKPSLVMVGHIRFHSRPDAGYLHPFARDAVEFGFLVSEPHRRQGYATEAARGAMGWAAAQPGVKRFLTTVAPANVPSMAMMKRLGFHKVGEHVDAEDGVEHVFVREA